MKIGNKKVKEIVIKDNTGELIADITDDDIISKTNVIVELMDASNNIDASVKKNKERAEEGEETDRKRAMRGTDSAKAMTIIRTISLIGEGTKENPARFLYQYWDLKGELLASRDTIRDSTSENLSHRSY